MSSRLILNWTQKMRTIGYGGALPLKPRITLAQDMKRTRKKHNSAFKA
jgi:hypothetical protein